MLSSTVKHDLAIAGNLRSLLGIVVLSKPVRIDAHRPGNALMASQTIPLAVEINNRDLFARVQLLFELFWRDSRHAKFAHKAMPSNKLAADVYRECSEHTKDPKHAQSGCVRGSAIQVSAEQRAESGIDA